MIRFACPGCQRKLSAKPAQAGKKGKCPKCGGPVRVPSIDVAADSPAEEVIPLEDAADDEHVHGLVDEHLPDVERLRALERPNRYWIVDKAQIVALWSSDGREWMWKTATGLVPARRDPTQLPAHGNFTIVAVIMKSTDQGLRLIGIRSYRLAERWSLPSLAKGEKTILGHIRGAGSLDSQQKLAVWNQIKSEFLPDVWQDASEVRQYLFDTDYH